MASGELSYSTTDSYNNTSSGAIKTTIPYEATYDPTTNSTTVVIGTVKHKYWSRASYSSSWYCSITVEAADSGYKAKTIVCYQGTMSNASKTNSATPVCTTLVVQHSEDSSTKEITITGTTRLNYIYSASSTTYTSKSYSAASAKAVTVATNQSPIKHKNKMFTDREHVLTSPDYRSSSSNAILGVTIFYRTNYDPNTNQTTIEFSKAATLNHTQNGNKLTGSIDITITPTDNEAGAVTVTLTVPTETTASAQTIGNTSLSGYSSNPVVVQHTNTEDGPRKVSVSMVPNVKFYYSSSAYWTFDNDYTNSFISGIYGDAPEGVVYIDTGTELIAYQVYIDNGTSWDLYTPYIDDGTSWHVCG